MKLVIRSAFTGDILYEPDYAAEEELRVRELRQHFCLAIGAQRSLLRSQHRKRRKN